MPIIEIPIGEEPDLTILNKTDYFIYILMNRQTT